MMAAHGLHYPGDYEVKDTGGVPPRHKALLEGSIDAGLQSIPWNYVAEEAGFKDFGEVSKYVPDWQFVTVNANNDWAKAHRPVLVRFLRALARATEWVHANRGLSAVIAERELPTRRDYAERAWDHYIGTNALARDMAVNRKGLDKVDRDADGGRAAAERRFDVDSGIHRRRLPARRSAFLARVQWRARCPEFGFLSWAMRHRM